jgi:Cd2+/Zn2+-exporting ATPase
MGWLSSCGKRSVPSTSRQNAGATTEPQPEPASGREALFRISAMDCATEEGEIRHALAGVDGIRGLRFLLAERVLAIDAEAAAPSSALTAIHAPPTSLAGTVM